MLTKGPDAVSSPDNSIAYANAEQTGDIDQSN
jgi:hypothetical protein